nr:MAG TPA: hypothetical protein [Caudoviricetes sp.]
MIVTAISFQQKHFPENQKQISQKQKQNRESRANHSPGGSKNFSTKRTEGAR